MIDLKKQTKAELIKIVGMQRDNIEELHAKMAEKKLATELHFGLDSSQQEPITEVGYLRKQLAYAQGQLHQSHLTVKQLCARINLTAQGDPPQPATYKAFLDDHDLGAINELSGCVRELMANLANQRDLSAAGVVLEKAPARPKMCDNNGHGDT